MADIIVNSFTKAGLPAAGTQGRLANVTDATRSLWLDNGTQWFQIAGQVCDVVDFGAKMNDSTARAANRTALQSAIRAAYDILVSGQGMGIVRIPPGVLYVTSAVVATSPSSVTGIAWIYPGVHIVGAGWSSLIDATDAGTTSFGLLGTNGTHAPNAAGGGDGSTVISASTDVQLRQFWIKGSSSQTGYVGLISILSNNLRWVVDTVRVSHCNSFNILLFANDTPVTDILISNCYIHDSGAQSGIVITDGARRVTVVGNICRSNHLYGIQVEDRRTSSDVTITGNVCESNQDSGIIAWGPALTSFTISSLTRSGSIATATTSSSHGFFTGALVRVAGATQGEYDGTFTITVTSATTFTYTVSGSPTTPATGTITVTNAYNNNIGIADNVCRDNVVNGILIGSGVEDVSVTGNVCRGNDNGIKVSASSGDCAHVTITGNTFTYNKSHGVIVQASSGKTLSNLALTANAILNNSQVSSSGAGVYLGGAGTLTDVSIVGNLLSDDQAVHTQRYGVFFDAGGTITRAAVIANSIAGNLTSQLQGLTTTTFAKDNAGNPVSAWRDVSYSASNFTGIDGGGWTVDSADVETYQYEEIEKTTQVNFSVTNTSVTKAASPPAPNNPYCLQLKIPNSRVSAKLVQGPISYKVGAAAWDVGFCQVLAGGTHVRMFRRDASVWPVSTNDVIVRGQIRFEFQ